MNHATAQYGIPDRSFIPNNPLVAAGRRPGGMQQVVGFTALQQGRGSIVQKQFNTQVFRPAALLPFSALALPGTTAPSGSSMTVPP